MHKIILIDLHETNRDIWCGPKHVECPYDNPRSFHRSDSQCQRLWDYNLHIRNPVKEKNEKQMRNVTQIYILLPKWLSLQMGSR